MVANYVALIGLIACVYAKDLPLRLRGAELADFRPARALLKPMFVKGMPMGRQMIVRSVSSLILIGLVNREGGVTAAAFDVAMQLWTYGQMPTMAVGAAVSTMVAQNIGADKWDRVGRITRAGIIQTLAITRVLVVLVTAAVPR